MATRPIFVPRIDGIRLVEELPITFEWNPGFAPVQKRKNVLALHGAAKRKGYNRLLEISTKSNETLGIQLSAFNLKVHANDIGLIPLENAYQGSKIFAKGGPFNDLYMANPRDAKRDLRLRQSGALKEFRFNKNIWRLEPKTAFYDWLYICALYEMPQASDTLMQYDGFTDIEFNPEKSINCQARSCAIFVSLVKKRLLTVAVHDKDEFIRILRPDSFSQPHSMELRQGQLF